MKGNEMKTFNKIGNVLTLTPGADVASGVGYLFGTSLFGVAVNTVANGVPGEFLVEGEVTIAKTSALAISVGDRLFWDATNKCVNKTTTAQQCVGIATSAASNPSATVTMKIGCYTAVAA
jgi:predicted RecA/RadA family phage recombinase